MDTPDKNCVTATSKFEDSPVFNYISNLSPIGPVESIQTGCAFTSPTFVSPPSLFASPQISVGRETRFLLRRHPFLEPSKPDLFYTGKETNTSEGVSAAIHNAGQLEFSISSEREITIEPPDQNSDLLIELPKTLKYDCGSPENDVVPCDAITTETVLDVAGTEALDELPLDDSKWAYHSLKSEINLRRICSIEKSKEACNWVTLVSGTADLLDVDLPINVGHFEEQDNKSVDPGTMSFISTVLQPPQDNANDLERSESVGAITSCKQCEIGEMASQSREIRDLKETHPTYTILSSTLHDKLVVGDSSDKVDHKGQKCTQARCKGHRSTRQRSLVFEMTGACKNKHICSYHSSTQVSIRCDCKVASDGKQLVHVNARSDCSSSIISHAGLHLNALSAASPKSMASGPDPNHFDESLSPKTWKSELFPCDSEAQITEDSPQTSTCAVGEEFDNSSPKRKRLKLEDVRESKACKRCNCKRSKCLKLYCECFAAGLYCVEPCLCLGCFNKPIHENMVLEIRRQIESRDPLAFAPKVIRGIDTNPDIGDEIKTPASARHKRGCNCKRSSCLKKYCECFQSGVGCTISCRCSGCKNTFGRKDGAQETYFKEEESETCEKNALDISLQKVNGLESDAKALAQSLQKVNKVGKELPDLPETSNISRPSTQLPSTFSGKCPPSYVASVKTSPRLCSSQKLGTSFSFSYRPRFERHLQMFPEDETPKVLDGKSDAISASPKSKRVAPSNRQFGSSTAWSGRKLILRAIPPFPSPLPPGEQ